MRFFMYVPRFIFTVLNAFYEGYLRGGRSSYFYQKSNGAEILSGLLLVGVLGSYYGGVYYKLVETSREIQMGTQTVEVPCVGLLDEKDENFKYQSSTGNLIAGILTADTVVGFPIYVLKGLWCPYKAKTEALPTLDLSDVPTDSDD